jgi:hypothetical protein
MHPQRAKSKWASWTFWKFASTVSNGEYGENTNEPTQEHQVSTHHKFMEHAWQNFVTTPPH